jgi:internalin A
MLLGSMPQRVHFSKMSVVKVVYGEVMTEEELLRVIARAKRENSTNLDLSSNQLSGLPESIGALSNLRVLDLRNNQLKRLSAAIGQLTNLQELYLYDNQLTNLPAAIGQLANLVILGLSDNQLIGLPDSLGQLKSLEILFLSGNNLTRLSPLVGELSSLIRLSLSENSLIELPSEIGQLVNLQRLDILSNKLTKLPESIAQLPNLQEVDTSGNPIQRIQIRMPKSNGRVISKQQIPKPIAVSALNTAKIMVVGQGNTGKTSLVKRLIHNQFALNETPTDGVSIEKWNVDFSTVVNKSEQEKNLGYFNVWDFGGRENMHSTHQLCMTERSLYLLVVNNNESDNHNLIEYWLQLISSRAKNSPVFIIGNKNDQASLDASYHDYRLKYVNIKGVFSVSCLDANGIPELSHYILKEVLNLQHLRTSFSQDWSAVKTKVENLNKGYITYAEYCQICGECNITSASVQQNLLELLRDLGTISVFYRDQPLSDTPVFNPAWIMYGIYKILNDHFLMSECKGILNEHMLTRILTTFQCNKREFTYTSEKHRLILETMVKLELCCKMNDKRSFLVPFLLPKEELVDAHLDRWSGTLQFQYHYAISPHSIIAYLMVRCGGLINKNLYWYHGVILESNDNYALVKSDPKEKKISIYVAGSPSTRRDFLLMLRHEFSAIHQIFGAFADPYVPLPDFPNIVVSYQQLLDSQAEGVEVVVPQGLRQKINVRELLDTIDVPDQLAHQFTVNGNGQTAQQVVTSIQTTSVQTNAAVSSEYVPSHLFAGYKNFYPAVTNPQLQEVQEIALRLVQGDLVDGEVDLLSSHLRAPLADAIQHLLGIPVLASERPDFQSMMIDDPFLE